MRRAAAIALAALSTYGGAAAAEDPFARRTAVVAAVEKAGPAVVNITTEQRRALVHPFFRDFFEAPFGNPFGRPRRAQNLGSGVIIDSQGHVLTNAHVIAQAEVIRITLADGREFAARRVGSDANNDLAVLALKPAAPNGAAQNGAAATGAKALPWIAPGRSADLMVGEPVIAIGNPFGLSNSVTTGVVSALNRSIRDQGRVFHGFLQTDASINPGNSGGALLNAEGALIGINTAIYQNAQGIGFAIPIDVAKRIVHELITKGEVAPVWLGLVLQNLTPQLRQALNLPAGLQGALVAQVRRQSPAQKAGIKRGDVIVQAEGAPLQNARAFYEHLERKTAGAPVRLKVRRAGAAADEAESLSALAEEIPAREIIRLGARKLGFTLAAPSRAQPRGYEITRVSEGGGAARAAWAARPRARVNIGAARRPALPLAPAAFLSARTFCAARALKRASTITARHEVPLMFPRLRPFRFVLLAALLVGLLIASPWVDVRVKVRDNIAAAAGELISLADGKTFWVEGAGEGKAVAPPAGAPLSFAELADAVKPSIVTIIATREPQQREVQEREMQQRRRRGFPFPFGFGFGFPFRFPMPMEPREGQGTGFIISTDGYVITNDHVVKEFDEIKVRSSDGDEYSAEVIGRDPNTDIALLRVKAEQELPALPLGNSDESRAGDWVLAIGNPFGLENTVTAGIISAKHRRINPNDSGRFEDFIQTDAAINFGNSGGPLVNLQGEAIGINTAIRRGAENVGFAVPINIAKRILPQLRSKGRVSRGLLGVKIQPVDAALAEALGLKDARGVLISSVTEGGAAEKAGIKHGDVIVSFEGKNIEEMDSLQQLVAEQPGGATVKMEALRDGRKMEFNVTLGELDPDTSEQEEEAEDARDYGFTTRTLTPEIAKRLRLDLEDARGAIITGVEPQSAAAEAGLRRGDIILEADGEEIKTREDLEEILESAAGDDKPLLLYVRRDDGAGFVPLNPPQPREE